MFILTDVQKPVTFSSVERFIEIIHAQCGRPVFIALVGNKADQDLDASKLTTAQTLGANLRSTYGLDTFLLVSAKDKLNIATPFGLFVDSLLSSRTAMASHPEHDAPGDSDSFGLVPPPPLRSHVAVGCFSGVMDLLPSSLRSVLCLPTPRR